MRRSIAPWWVFPCAASFLAYFALLIYCDLWRPVPEGLELTSAAGRPGLAVKEVTAGSPAARAGIRVDDRVLSADRHPVNSKSEWEAVQLNVAFGRPIALEVERDGITFGAEWVVTQAGQDYWRRREGIDLLVTRLVQFITLVLGLVVVFRRPFDAGARLGGWLLATFGVFCIVLPSRFADVWHGMPELAGAALWLPLASTLVLPALLLSFFLSFPRRELRSPVAWIAILTPAALIAAARLRFLGSVVYRPAAGLPADWFGWRWGGWIGYLSAAAVVAFVKYRRADPVERRRLSVLLLGGGVGAVAGGPIALAYQRGSETALFASPAVALATLGLLVVPLSFAYATLRHRLFDVRFIIRRGVQYALARRLLLSIVPVLLVAMAADIYWHRDRSIGEQFGARAPLYGGLAVLALVATRQRQRWLEALDRRFFRERYDAQRLLHQVIEEVRRAGSLQQAAGLVVAQIERALHPRFVTLLSRAADGDSYKMVATAPGSAGPEVLPGGAKLCALARVLRKPLDLSAAGATWLAEHLPPAEAAMVGEIGLDVLVPIDAAPGRPDAILALGARRSEEPYAREDQQLLWTIAESLAVLDGHDIRTSPARGAAFEECPMCGTCYDAGASTCAGDAAGLTVVGLPRVLSQRYRLEQRLGRGGMGVVYAASDISLDRTVAVKVLREELVGDRESAARFEREARISASFSHPNVVTVFDFGVVGESRAFLVMERLEGATLRDELRGGPFGSVRVLAIMRGVCEAVDAAHRRHLIHRDLKPENVFLAHDDGPERPKILDFGIAKALAGSRRRDDHETTMGVLLGTRQYMAPEQLRGESPEPSWDIWALALIVHEMLTGYHPFASLAIGLTGGGVPTAQPMAPRESGPVSPRWQPFFARWLAIDVAQRPESAAALYGELEQMLRQG